MHSGPSRHCWHDCGLLAAGHDVDAVLAAYPYLERDDIRQVLAYAAWRSEEQEVAIGSSRST